MLRKYSILLIIIGVTSLSSIAQKGSQSPYSILGLGELNNGEYAVFSSMGGVLMANTDSTIVNHLNPASYSYIKRHQPVFQIGMNGRLSTFSTETAEISRQHFGLNQFQLGLPIKKNWGAAVSLMPYSFTGYTVSNTVAMGTDTTKFINEGSGGINKFQFGLSYRPLNVTKDSLHTSGDTVRVYKTHSLSFGANASYLFGATRQYRSYEYVTFATGYNSRVENGLRLAGFVYDFGVSYQTTISKRPIGSKRSKTKSIGVGLSYSPAMKVKAYQDLLSFTYLGSFYDGAPLTVDTIEYVVDNEGSVYIPESYRLGIGYTIFPGGQSQIRFGADVNYQKWSAFYLDFGAVENDSLKDRLSLGFGLEYSPSGSLRFSGTEPFFSRLSYRFGVNYAQTELSVQNSLGERVNIDNYGMSFGIGLPISVNRSFTNINFGATLGNLGTKENGLIQERYLGLYFGLSITPGRGDLWFIKRKYD